MAPHDTNTPREARRHWGPLVGMAAAILAVVVGVFLWAMGVVSGPDVTQDADAAAAERAE
jgi:hypothetical protein